MLLQITRSQMKILNLKNFYDIISGAVIMAPIQLERQKTRILKQLLTYPRIFLKDFSFLDDEIIA